MLDCRPLSSGFMTANCRELLPIHRVLAGEEIAMNDNSVSRGLTGLNHGTWVAVIQDENNLGWGDPLATPTFTTGNAGERP